MTKTYDNTDREGLLCILLDKLFKHPKLQESSLQDLSEYLDISAKELSSLMESCSETADYELNKDTFGEPVIEAVAQTDDYKIKVHFDAVSYLEQCQSVELVELVRNGMGYSYTADHIAYFYANGPTRAMFDYLALTEGVGFECWIVDKEKFIDWLQENRPDDYQLLKEAGEI